jgi:acid phosphatase (class B)
VNNIPVTKLSLLRLVFLERRTLLALLFAGLAFGSFTGCSTAHKYRIAETAAGTKAHFITLSDLEKSLPPTPIVAVFDIDDTTLFTSGGFQWGAKHYGNDIVSAGVSVREADLKTDEDKRKFREFWTRMNNDLDEYSVPKWIARELIELHKKRGDKIYFVTKRINTGSEHLTALLKEWFVLPNLEPVIFTQREPKTSAFLKIHAQISYGDSDGDIRDSIAAGARPIRVMRARTSVNHEPTHNGAFGEDVLINSEF